MKPKNVRLALAIGIAVYILASFGLACYKYANFGYTGLDLAIYNNTFWQTLHGHLFGSSIHPPSYLGDHTEWFILALIPFYALVSHPLTLVFLKLVALGLSAIPVYVFARRALTDQRLAPLFPLLWLINSFVWSVGLFEFNLIVFAIPFILGAACFFQTKRWGWFVALVVIALLVREDIGLSIVGFSALATLEAWRDRKTAKWNIKKILQWIVAPTALSLYFFIIDQLVIKHFNPEGAYKYFVYYEWLAPTPAQVPWAILSHPLVFLGHFLKADNLAFVVVLFLPVLFTPLFRPRYLLLTAIPFLEYLMTKMGCQLVILQSQYVSLFLPALFLATIEGYEALAVSRGWPAKFIPRKIFPLLLVVASVNLWITFGVGRDLAKSLKPDAQKTQRLESAIAQIPDGSSVVSALDPLTNLSGRFKVWPITYAWIGKKQFNAADYKLPEMPDYFLLSKNDFLYFVLSYGSWPTYTTAGERLRGLFADGQYGTIFQNADIAVMKRGIGYEGVNFIRRYATKPKIDHPQETACGEIKFLGWNGPDGDNKLTRLYFQSSGKLTGDPVLKIDGEYYPLGNGVYSPKDWQAGETLEIPVDGKLPLKKLLLTEIKGGLNTNSLNILYLQVDKEIPVCPEMTIAGN